VRNFIIELLLLAILSSQAFGQDVRKARSKTCVVAPSA
jgi:hypothetical protein